MRWIPPGEFMMGSPEDEPQRYDDEGPQHRVVFEQGYWLAETACTQELWQSVMKNVPSEFKDNPQNPVENVAWKDADKFSKIINKQLGDGAFRLPSEAEWEYACRAGTVTPFWWGNELSTDQANYNGKHPYNDGNKGEYRSKTLPVKSFHPNPWGLYQMHGNVWEWCQDRWHDDYRDAPDNGEPWEEGDSESRVCRGGSWFDHGRYLRSASRLHDFFGDGYHGFRLARGPESSRQARAGEAVGRQGGRDDRQTRHGIDGGGENENQDL